MLLDAGANAEVQPDWLVQFAQMGSVYARTRFHIDEPHVSVCCRSARSRARAIRCARMPSRCSSSAAAINFIGNIEGRDVMSDTVDVAVTDGFTGNVTLKTLEGGMKALIAALLAAFAEDGYREHADALLPALVPLYNTLNPDTYGGAVLLGVDGVCIISHGSSGATAIRNAIGVAAEMVEHRMVDEIKAIV